jgi:Lipid A 3-O-deacylase (PagL)
MRLAPSLAALLTLAPALARAQDVQGTPESSDRSLGGWIGTSVSPSDRFGYVTDRRLFVAGVRAEFLLDTFGPFALASTVDVVPLAVLSNTPEYRMMAFRVESGMVQRFKIETGRSAVLGAGVIPAGLRLYTRSTQPARFFVGTSAGMLWFTRDTPIPDARRMNISVEAGGGVELQARDGRALVVGYRFQHLSNAGTARQNPGVDAHVVYLGVMRRRGAKKAAPEGPTVVE